MGHAVFANPFVYPIVDVDVCHSRRLDAAALAHACLRGGARVLQVRQKGGGSAAFLDLARRVVHRGLEFDATVIVNDRADLAKLAGAAGVHVGQDDLDVEDARRVGGVELVVGVSTHDAAQVDLAAAGSATYIAVGPVYGTMTKDTGYAARGLELVRYAASRPKPVVAIGGITLERVAELLEAGARGLAVISDLLVTGDAEQRIREYAAAIDSAAGRNRI